MSYRNAGILMGLCMTVAGSWSGWAGEGKFDPPPLSPEILALADVNHDGQVTFEELHAVAPIINQDMFDEFDRNDDGVLSEADLHSDDDPPPPSLELLLQADVNHDGQVTFEELHAVAPHIDQELFNEFDRNDDGVLNEADLHPDDGEDESDGKDPLEILMYLLDVADLNSDEQISPEEVQALVPGFPVDVFSQLDRNNDGVLSVADLPPPPVDDPLEHLLRLLEEADANGDGEVALDEIRALVPDFPENVFNELDHNGDGVLSYEDLPPPNDHDPFHELLDLLEHADANEDGELTLEEVRAVAPDFPEEFFNRLDTNGDGVLSNADLPPPPPYNPIERLLELLHNVDADHNGEVTLDEIRVAIPDFPQEAFDHLDFNGDGVLSFEDLPSVPLDDPLARLLELISRADANNDGEVTLEELRAIVPDFPEDVFDDLDHNDDGVLSREDLPLEPPEGPCERLRRILHEADANDDGEVTFEELQAVVPEVTQEQFNQADANGDGVLSREDLPAFSCDPTEALIDLIRSADVNQDGIVTFEELQAVLPNLTHEQFDELDRNDDGVLSHDDKPEPPSDPIERLIRLLLDADVDNDRIVTFDELLAVAPDLTQEQFDELDRNDDGVISEEDLPNHPDPDDYFEDLLDEADTNNDGQLTYEELLVVLPELTQEKFDELDTNDDGVLTEADFEFDPVPHTDDLREELLRALVTADTNQDGELDYAEIAAAFPNAPSDLLAQLDTNHDWAISRSELHHLLGHGLDDRELIREHDLDGDGSTNATDVQNSINQALGFFSNLLPADLDDDGVVGATDIQKIINGALGLI